MSNPGIGPSLHAVEDMSSIDKLDNYFKALAMQERGNLNSVSSDAGHSSRDISLDTSQNTSDAEDEAHFAVSHAPVYTNRGVDECAKITCGMDIMNRAETCATTKHLSNKNHAQPRMERSTSHCIASTEEEDSSVEAEGSEADSTYNDLDHYKKEQLVISLFSARLSSIEGKLVKVLHENETLSTRVQSLESSFKSALEYITLSKTQQKPSRLHSLHTFQHSDAHVQSTQGQASRLGRSYSDSQNSATATSTYVVDKPLQTVSTMPPASSPVSLEDLSAESRPTSGNSIPNVVVEQPSKDDIRIPSTSLSANDDDTDMSSPYEIYLDLCQRYGRRFCPEAMLAFVSNAQVLRCSYVADEDMLPICIALKSNAYIRAIEILGGLGDNGAIHLAEALKYNSNVVNVTISNCPVRQLGASALAAWLRSSPNVVSICLRGCDIRDVGAEEFADAMSNHRNLSTLELSRNNIGCTGAAAIGAALKGTRRLNSLSLEGNHIGREGGKVLADGLRRSHSLLTLNLQDNPELECDELLQQSFRRYLNRNINSIERLC